MSNYTKLADRVSDNRLSMVQYMLNKDNSLDLTYDNGTYFRMSIENNSYDIVKVLLDYFEENQLSEYTEGSAEYLSLKGKLQDIITDIAEDNDNISPKLKDVIQPYLLDQVSTTDSLNKDSDISDPIDNFYPDKHFSDNSTQDSTPEKELSGDIDANTNTFYV